MKRAFALVLAAALLLCACEQTVSAPTEATTEETAVATTEAPTTEAPTEAPTDPPTEPEPVYTNPLTGEVIEEPLSTRIFGVTINNLSEAIPHYGVANADIYLEMLVNGSIIRGLALFADPSDVSAIGSVRSTRIMFNQLALHYDAIIAHAGGSSYVLNNASDTGVSNFSIDVSDSSDYSFRDSDRFKSGYTWDACLFARGEGLKARAEEKGITVEQDPEKDYNMRFVEDGTPADGETASSVSVTFTFKGTKKETVMVYNEELGKYVYNQYNKEMVDGATGEPEAFENVVVLLAELEWVGSAYHKADFITGGSGYFACGGKIIPITWGCDDDNSPIWYRTADGNELNFGVGNTYIAIASTESAVVYE